MIQIHVCSNKVKKVLFLASTETEEDRDLTVWQVIRPLVTRIDKLLKKRGVDELAAQTSVEP